MEFGTGALKVTPAHDVNDFEIMKRHNLELIKVIDEDGKMNENAIHYRGMDRFECREKIVEELKEKGFLEKMEPYQSASANAIAARPSLNRLFRSSGSSG